MVLTDIIRDFPRQALHSYHLSFEDIDTNETRTFEAPIPDVITNLCNILEKHI